MGCLRLGWQLPAWRGTRGELVGFGRLSRAGETLRERSGDGHNIHALVGAATLHQVAVGFRLWRRSSTGLGSELGQQHQLRQSIRGVFNSSGRLVAVLRKVLARKPPRVKPTQESSFMTSRLAAETIQRVPERGTRFVERKWRRRRYLLYMVGIGILAVLSLLVWPPASQSAAPSTEGSVPRRRGLSLRAPRPALVGQGLVNACPPKSQNCVSSRGKPDAPTFEPPWRYPATLSAEEALALVRHAVRQYPGPETSTIIQYKPAQYLYAEFQTRLMGFVDDAEFLVDEQAHLIHYRSASRIGRSDMGANRARLRTLFAELAARGFSLATDRATVVL
ncbi:hypothetical protein CCYA_CCYA14G3665 [Cyanidiococcus yangmingshanensis]|nr:hypothetical protein CCYA_CCYA14G3665 [Cyanidiococcus yangmingshanensis]